MEFSKKLYELRKQKGISQEELADRLDVSRQTLSKWELGTSTPDTEKLVMISDYFEISLDELVLGKKQEEAASGTSGGMSQILEQKVFTEDNKKKTKKGLKIAGIVLAVLLAVDIISMIIYFIVYGTPK